MAAAAAPSLLSRSCNEATQSRQWNENDSQERGHLQMTSAVGGGTPKGDESTDKLREWESEKGLRMKQRKEFRR